MLKNKDTITLSLPPNIIINNHVSFWQRLQANERYGEVLGEVKLRELEVEVIGRGKFGLVIDGPFKGYKVKIVGYRGQVLPQTTRYTYEVRPWNINDLGCFNKLELGIPLEDIVPYTKANILLYGS